MSERNLVKNLVGTVVSDKMTNRCRSNSSTNVKHPLYKKIIKRTVKFKAHDEKQSATSATAFRCYGRPAPFQNRDGALLK